MVYEKVKIIIIVYFVTYVHRSILNIVSTTLSHTSMNKRKILQNIKRVGQSFYILTIFIL